MGRSKIGVDHTGKSRAFAQPGEKTLAVHHDPGLARQHDKPDATAHLLGHRGHPTATVVDGKTVRDPRVLDIQPRAGAPKALHPVAPHVSTTPRQLAAAGKGGMGHGTAAVTDGGQTITTDAAAAPMQDHYGGALPKNHQPAKPSWGVPGGMGQGVDHDAAHKIAVEALVNSAPDDRSAYGGINEKR
jgi:hypothetical protein